MCWWHRVYILPFTFHSLSISVQMEIALLVPQGLPFMFYSSQSSSIHAILCTWSFRAPLGSLQGLPFNFYFRCFFNMVIIEYLPFSIKTYVQHSLYFTTDCQEHEYKHYDTWEACTGWLAGFTYGFVGLSLWSANENLLWYGGTGDRV